MRHSTVTVLVLSIASVWASTEAWADMIDVRGKGMLNGTIISESEEEVFFQDSWGRIQKFPKEDILLMDRSESKAPAVSEPMPSPAAPETQPSTARPGSTKGRSGPVRPDPRRAPSTPEEDQQVSPTFQQRADAFSDRIVAAVFRAAFGFVSTEPESRQKFVDQAQQGATQVNLLRSGEFTGNRSVAMLGILLMMVGAMAAVFFGFQLLFTVFSEEGILWGMVLLGGSFGYMAPMIGGLGGLLCFIPLFLGWYFIATHWRLTRQPIISQCFSLDISLLGFLILLTVL